ncbi:DUF6364 family protein [Zunongwangia sp. F363]|uniref:DUF6364 family protein n=1 Tax=Autumnicola tepida TaxID=3075595 RepID=A0ABU3CFA0_9FLAO|nr:DUF6364 family protein [Zunongwangia sp. F363]MDT0645019.1 DUF6364 family protein [Zunongwangia sp. F363]
MDKKLTLSLNESIIETAKRYAKANNISLSKLIESYLGSLTKEEMKKMEISPLVKSLSGVITVDENYDPQDDYTQYLIEKYK